MNTVTEDATFWKRSLEWKFLKSSFSCFRGDGENQNLSKPMTSQYWIQPSNAKENGGIWWFYVYALHKKRLWNILGCQKYVQSYCTNYFFWRYILRNKQIQNVRVLCLRGFTNIFRRLCDFVPKSDFQKALNCPSIQTNESVLPFLTCFPDYDSSNIKWHHSLHGKYAYTLSSISVLSVFTPVWTRCFFENGEKKIRFQTKTDTCGRGRLN